MKETADPTPTESISKSASTVARRVGLIMTYNQRETCIEAIKSLITQTLSLDLIIISDDCSTDGTYEVIKNYLLQNNQHDNIKISQSENNLGFIPHFNTVIKEHCAESDLIYYNAGDDISEANRVEEFYRDYVAKENPRYFLGHSYVTSFGSGTEEILVPPIESIKENRELCLIASAYHIGASQVFTGALFFDFGPILFDDCYEDLTLGYRALLKNAYHFIPKALLRYRVGGLSSWQKNPLEKKRGRLKSTLTQRAVDSMRSGDLGALSTIQDCYTQYGFAHTTHKDRVEILVVGEQVNEIDIYGYSVADHFPSISNICKAETVSPDSFKSSELANTKQLVWLKISTLKYEYLHALLSNRSTINDASLIFDYGLLGPSSPFTPDTSTLQMAAQMANHFPKALVHTACPSFLSRFSDLNITPRITYIPPLQSIDGFAPSIERPIRKRGVVFALGSTKIIDIALSALKAANGAHISTVSEIDIIKLSTMTHRFRSKRQFSMTATSISSPKSINSNDIDFVITLVDPGAESLSLLSYCWGFSAKYGLPIFINAEATLHSDLKHGENCLFVDSDLSSWRKAMSLVSENYVALQKIALRARNNAYFNFSIQKRVAEVLGPLRKASYKSNFFDKFLPL